MKFWFLILLGLAPMSVQAQTFNDPVPLQPSQPSLWWQSDRLGSGLIESWIIDADTKLIKLQINSQVWIAQDYLNRYAIMQKLGNVARQNNYNIRLENNRQIRLAEYRYREDKWQIVPRLLGANPFSANNGIFFGLR